MDALEAIAARKSVRAYLEKPVEAQKIAALVAAGKNAPKSGEFHMTVIENKELLQDINGKALNAMKNSGNQFSMSRAALDGYQPLYGAPLLIVLSAPEESRYAMACCSCAAANITIAAAALELGSCYLVSPLTVLNQGKEYLQKFGLPANWKAICCVIAGYPGGDAFSMPKKEKDNVTYIK